MATNIEEIFRSFVVNKIKEIEDEKHQSGKMINEANGEVKLVVEPKESEVVADTTVETQEEPIVNSSDQALSGLDEKQSDNPDNKENMTVDNIAEQINCPALDNKVDSSTPPTKSKKHKHRHHHKHKSKKKKKKKRKKDNKKRDRSRSRSKSQMNLKSESDLKLQSRSQSKSHSKSPLHTECSSSESKNCSLLMESGNTGSNKNTFAETIDTNTVTPVAVERECSVDESKPLPQDSCNIGQHAKENSAVDTNNVVEYAATGNASGLLAAESACEQDQTSRLILDRSSDNVESKSTQITEEKNKHDQTEGRRTKRSRSRSHSKSTKHLKSQLHSHSQHSPVKKSCTSSSSRRHASQSSFSRKRSSPARHRSKSTSRERKKHTESSPKSKRKPSRSRSITKKEKQSKSKSRSPIRIHHKSRSNSVARSKCQSNLKSRRSRSCSRSKRRSRTRSGSPTRSKSRIKRSHSPRPRSRSNDRVCHRLPSRGYQSRLVRTRRSPNWRRRSRSPLRRKSTSRTPERLTDLDKAQLLEIAKANAAAMCAKAGMPLPANLKPVVPLVKKVMTKKMGCSSIQELTEKCKKIVESNDDNELGNKPRDSEEDEPFSNQPIKVNELKPISFSLNTPVFKPLSSHPQ